MRGRAAALTLLQTIPPAILPRQQETQKQHANDLEEVAANDAPDAERIDGCLVGLIKERTGNVALCDVALAECA